MTSFAIYELFGFIIALPLSYLMAYWARKYSNYTYKDELERIYMAVWNGEEEDELNAWLKVNQIYIDKKAPKKKKFIQKKIAGLNKQQLYSHTTVDQKGNLIRRGEALNSMD